MKQHLLRGTNKWKVLKRRKFENKPDFDNHPGGRRSPESTCGRDLGVDIMLNKSSENHMRRIVGIPNYILVKPVIEYVGNEMLTMIQTTCVWVKLNFALIVCSPHFRKHTELLEEVHGGNATWMILEWVMKEEWEKGNKEESNNYL